MVYIMLYIALVSADRRGPLRQTFNENVWLRGPNQATSGCYNESLGIPTKPQVDVTIKA